MATFATFATCALLVSANVAQAATWYVDKAGNNANSCTAPGNAGACLTINGALGKAGVTDGDTISIGPGYYDEGVITSKNLNFVGAGPGTATGFDPATDTVIDSNGVPSAPALRVDNAGGSVSDIRLLGAYSSEGPGVSGEGLYLNPSTAVGPALSYQVSDVVAIGGHALADNIPDEEGLRIDDGGSGRGLSASVTGSYFSVPGGKGAYVVRVYGTNVSASIHTSTVVPKTAATGGIVDHGAALTLDASQVTGTDASASGVVANDPTTTLSVTHSVLAAREGSALGLVEGATADVIDSLVWLQPDPFQDNSGIQDAAARVQSVYHAGLTSQLTATGSTFVARAKGVEAGVAVGCPACVGVSVANLRNSILQATDTDASPGDVDLLANAGLGGTATISATNSLFGDSSQTNGGTAAQAGSGSNVAGDPLFADEAGGNFTLQGSSPAIDRGDPSLVSAGELDLAGNPRAQAYFLDCAVNPDMGAYELPGAPAACPASSEPPAAPAAPASPSESDPVLTISSSRVRATRGGVARIALRCQGSGGGKCEGKLTLRSSKRFAIVARGKRRRKKVRLGSAKFAIAPGGSARVKVKISRRAFALLKRERALRVTASGVTRAASGSQRTARGLLSVRAPKPRPKPRH